MTTNAYDIAIIGGGIAGSAVAAAVGAHASVVLIEAETEYGVHSTGRSAAMSIQTYGNAEVQQLTALSRAALEGPLTERAGPILTSRPVLWTGRAEDKLLPDLRELAATPHASRVQWLNPVDAALLAPAVDPHAIELACLDLDAASIDVDRLHRVLLAIAKDHGAELLRSSTVRGLARRGDVWDITLERGTLTAGMVVNAAGARADHIAALAGLSPAGLSPLLRTAIIATCDPPATVHWPFVVDLDDQYYFEPFGAQILASPADETPATAGHVRPDDLDVALCIERLHERTRLHVRRVTTSWAGLRTFAADRRPVLGPHPEDPSFLWCAGLGGFGIMTAPACGDIVADHVLGRPRSDLSRACLPTRQAASA